MVHHRAGRYGADQPAARLHDLHRPDATSVPLGRSIGLLYLGNAWPEQASPLRDAGRRFSAPNRLFLPLRQPWSGLKRFIPHPGRFVSTRCAGSAGLFLGRHESWLPPRLSIVSPRHIERRNTSNPPSPALTHPSQSRGESLKGGEEHGGHTTSGTHQRKHWRGPAACFPTRASNPRRLRLCP